MGVPCAIYRKNFQAPVWKGRRPVFCARGRMAGKWKNMPFILHKEEKGRPEAQGKSPKIRGKD